MLKYIIFLFGLLGFHHILSKIRYGQSGGAIKDTSDTTSELNMTGELNSINKKLTYTDPTDIDNEKIETLSKKVRGMEEKLEKDKELLETKKQVYKEKLSQTNINKKKLNDMLKTYNKRVKDSENYLDRARESMDLNKTLLRDISSKILNSTHTPNNLSYIVDKDDIKTSAGLKGCPVYEPTSPVNVLDISKMGFGSVAATSWKP